MIVLLPASTAVAKRNVCTATINSSEEKEAFMKHLNPKDFNFIELTSFKDKDQPEQNGEDWFRLACEAKVSCDVLIISGHFGGTFFSDKNQDLYLSSDLMEKQSCSKTCEGILSNPKEVFLFGCNTLATKDQDHRTPEEYLRVLLNDGIERAQAERIVQARYGAMGSSFKDRMQRIFAGVPLIHGFDSVGPSGKTVKPFLNKYFKDAGDYSDKINKLEAEKLFNLIERGNKKIANLNKSFASVLASTAYTYCVGLQANDEQAQIKAKICQLYDDSKSVEERLVAVENMLLSNDRMLYMPSIADFFTNNYFDEKSKVFNRIKSNPAIKNEIEKVAKALRGSPSVYVEVINLQKQMKHITSEEYNDKLLVMIRDQFKNLNRETVDLMCSLKNQNVKLPSVTLEDFPVSASKNPYFPKIFSCLSTKDSRLTKEVLKTAQSSNGEHRTDSLIALLSMPGYEQEKNNFAKAEFNSAKGLRKFYAKNLIGLSSSDHSEIVSSVRYIISDNYNHQIAREIILAKGLIDEGLAQDLFENLKRKTRDRDALINLSLVTPQSSKVWKDLEKMINNSEVARDDFVESLSYHTQPNPQITNWVISQMSSKNDDITKVYTLGRNYFKYLSSQPLTEENKKSLFKLLEANSIEEYAPFLRGLLVKQNKGSYDEHRKKLLQGPVSYWHNY